MPEIMDQPEVAAAPKKKLRKAKRKMGKAPKPAAAQGIQVHVNVTNHHGDGSAKRHSGNTADDALYRLRGY